MVHTVVCGALPAVDHPNRCTPWVPLVVLCSGLGHLLVWAVQVPKHRAVVTGPFHRRRVPLAMGLAVRQHGAD